MKQQTIDGFDVIRVAEVDENGNPILKPGEGAIERDGVFYVIDDQIALE
jgi:hypothetical protein